jgi:hypothetical protein
MSAPGAEDDCDRLANMRMQSVLQECRETASISRNIVRHATCDIGEPVAKRVQTNRARK